MRKGDAMAAKTGIIDCLDAAVQHGVIGYQIRGSRDFALLLGNGNCLVVYGDCPDGDVTLEYKLFDDVDYSQLRERWDRMREDAAWSDWVI